MADFKVGDKARIVTEKWKHSDYWRKGTKGVLVQGVGGDFPFELKIEGAGFTMPVRLDEIVPVGYDEATKDALVAHFRKQGMTIIPDQLEDAWDAITAPKTHTVVVEFEVEDGEDIVAVLDQTDIDYTIKEA